jgi:transcription antitermination factor NusG
MALAWYVLRSKPNKEDFFCGQLLAHRVETFYPRVQVRTVNPRARKIRPYFPGYLFVHVDFEVINSSSLHWLPGSGGLVSFDLIPASVPDVMIASIRRKVDEITLSTTQPLIGIKHGDRVLITDGPFTGQDAIFDNCRNGNERVRVLIQYLHNRSLPIDLPVGQIKINTMPAAYTRMA